MGHLLEIILNILGMILPMPDSQRSAAGESRMDKYARWWAGIFYGLLVLFLLAAIVWFSIR